MPIRPYIAPEDSFDPDMCRIMGTALESACAELGLADKLDKATEVVAQRVMELARRGERDPERLKAEVVRSFRSRMQ